MAQFTPSKKTAQDFNNGVEYVDYDAENGIMGDAVNAESINNVIEGLLYTQGLAANQPDDSEADSYGTVSVEIIDMPDGTAKIKLKNLKGNGISETATTYAISTSGTDIPSEWYNYIPTVGEGQYLWTKIETTYNNATKNISYTIAKQGKQGIQGESGRPVFLYSGIVQKMSDGAYVLISGKNYWSPTVSDGLHSGDIIIYTFEGITYIDAAQGIGSLNKWQVQQDRLGTRITGNDGTSVDTSNLVTTDTDQAISGKKSFAKNIRVGDALSNTEYGSSGMAHTITSGKVSHTYNAYIPAKTGTIALIDDVTPKMDKSAFSLSGTTLTITL